MRQWSKRGSQNVDSNTYSTVQVYSVSLTNRGENLTVHDINTCMHDLSLYGSDNERSHRPCHLSGTAI